MYKNAKTAQALSLIFLEQAPELKFNNPVLGPFSNAIWHCGSAAEVAVILNETSTKLPDLEDRADSAEMQKSALHSTTELFDVIAQLGELMENYPSHVLDISLLPTPKARMKG